MKLVRILTVTAALAFSGAAWAQTKWDMPTPYPLNNFHTVNIEIFARDVDKATNGRLKITVHPGASLLKLPEIKRGVQTGQVPIGEILIAAYANEDPLFQLDSVPFLATSYAEARKLMETSRKAMDEKFAKQGMKVLFSVPWPPQGLYANRPINTAADLKGLKWRAYSPGTARIGELVGAQSVTVQAAELAQALATGAVQAQMTSGATGYDSKIWESPLKSYYDLKAWLPRNVVFVNARAFNALPKDIQEAVLQSAKDAEERGWRFSEEKDRWYLEQLAAKGVKVEPGSPQLKSDMKQIGATMTSEWTKNSGADGKAIIDAYQKRK